MLISIVKMKNCGPCFTDDRFWVDEPLHPPRERIYAIGGLDFFV